MRLRILGALMMAAHLVACGPLEGGELESDVAVEQDSLASSVLIGKVVAYGTTNGSESGPREVLGPGVYHSAGNELLQVGADIQLIELGPAMRVRICHEFTVTLTNCEYAENLTASNKRVAVTPPVSRLDVRALVVGYQQANFSGAAQGFEVGVHQTSRGQLSRVGNDTISSIRVAPGLQVQLCSDNPETTVGPACQWFTSDVAQLPTRLDDATSWIQVLPASLLHRDAGFVGPKQALQFGTLAASDLTTVGNDAVSSVTVHEGVKVKLCSDDPTRTVGYSCIETTDSNSQLPSSIDNRTSWVQARVGAILLPLNEEQYVGTQTVSLRALARSPVDGAVSPANVTWRSDRDGELGSGLAKVVQLSVDGCALTRHRISLRVIDSRGVITDSFRDVYVKRLC
jgi:hypothetical protein